VGLPISAMDTKSKYFRIGRKDIAYLKFLIESYEGMAVLRTKDPHEAIVELMVAPGWENEMDGVVKGIQREICMEAVPWPDKEPSAEEEP
jgi:hypothetical protein